MQAKRWLAALLCAALVITSGAFSVGASATETPGDPAGTGGVQATTAPSPSATAKASATPSAAAPTAAATVAPAATTGPAASASPEDTGKTEASAAPTVTPTVAPSTEKDEQEDNTPASTAVPQTTPEPSATTAPEASAVPSATASPEGTATPEASATPEGTAAPEASATPEGTAAPTATASPTPAISEEALGNLDGVVFTAGLGVDADGKLVWDGTTVLSGEVTIPAGVKTIPAGIFNDTKNKGITALKFSDTKDLTAIEALAFYSSSIEKAEFPAVTSIGHDAFSGCQNLKRVTLDKIVTIGDQAFMGCSKLDDLSLGSTLTEVGAYAFTNCAIDKLDLSSRKGDLTLGKAAFSGNSNMTQVTLSSGLLAIPEECFQGCPKLNKVNFDAADLKLETIGKNAFSGCTAFTALVFGNDGTSTIRRFCNGAFAGCNNLVSVEIYYPDPDSETFTIETDAFPALGSKLTMRGYDGKVEGYAATRKYKYSTLNAVNSITYKVADKSKDHISISGTVSSAKKGEEVIFTVKPAKDYVVDTITIVANKTNDPVPELVSSKDGTMKFRFIMPAKATTVTVSAKEASKAVTGTLTFTVDRVNGYRPEKNDKGDEYTFDQTGRTAQLAISETTSTGAVNELGNWLFTYASSKTSVATISQTGLITALTEGESKITATLTGTTKKVEFKVIVNNSAKIGHIEILKPNPFPSMAKWAGTENIRIDEKPVTAAVLIYEKSWVASAARSFDLPIGMYDENDEEHQKNLTLKSKWTSADTDIATVASETVSGKNTNKITVKKGAVGDAMITVSVTNPGDKEPSVKAYFIVRVVDAMPRVTGGSFTVNNQSTVGTVLPVAEMYGYTVKDSHSDNAFKLVDKDGVKCNTLNVVYDANDGNYRIEVAEPGKTKAKTYTGSTQLYLAGTFEDAPSTGADFKVPIKTITITEKKLSPNIKISGQFNVFYSGAKAGDVVLSQDTKTKINGIEFVSLANYEKEGKETPDTFAEAYVTEPQRDKKNALTGKWVIRKREDYPLDKKAPVTGYVYVYFEGFENPVKKKVTFATTDTAPKYVLSSTSTTASIAAKDQTIELRLLDEKTKKKALTFTEGTLIGLTGSTSRGSDGLAYTIEQKEGSTDTLLLRMKGEPVAGKAVIFVQLPNWSKQINYTFTVKTTNKKPTLKFKDKISLNRSYPATAYAVPSIAQKDVTITDCAVTGGTSGIAITYDTDLKKFAVTFDGTGTPEAGTYKFKVTATANVGSIEGMTLDAATLTVKVKETVPKITLKKDKLTLNTKYAGTETASSAYSLSGRPSGVAVKDALMDLSGVTFTASSKTKKAFNEIAELTFDEANAKLNVTLKEEGKYADDGTYTYTVSGLKAGNATVKNFKLKLKLRSGNADVTLSKKGTINPVDRSTKITYTTTLKNVTGTVTDIKVWEKADNGVYIGGNDTPVESPHFTAVLSEKKKNVLTLTQAATSEGLESGKTYKLTLVYTLNGDDAHPVRKNVSVKPKQTVPKITTDKTKATVIGGSMNPVVQIKITPDKASNAELTGVEFASGTSVKIRDAFTIDALDDNGDGTYTATLRLTNPARIKAKKYDLKLVTRYDGQAEKSTANKFTIAVTVKK